MSAVTTLLSLVPCLTLLAPPAQPAAPAPEQARMLSQVLPETLAAFLDRAGADRALSDLPPGAADNLFADEPDMDLLVETLQPRNYLGMGNAKVTLMGVVEPKEADAATGGQILLVAGKTVLLEDGTAFAPGDELVLGDVVVEGVVLNAGDTTILLETSHLGEIMLPPGEAFVVSESCKSCSVECNTGFYACCLTTSRGCCRCPCRKDGDSDTGCTNGGGAGAHRCSCGQEATQFIGP